MSMKRTPGPWRFQITSGTVHLQSLSGRRCVVMSFARLGRSGAQPLFRDDSSVLRPVAEFSVACPGREHHDWFRLIKHPDAQLIEAAPDLLEYAEFMERYDRFIDEVNAAWGTPLGGDLGFWKILDRLLPELTTACPELSSEEFAGYELPDTPEWRANARTGHYGYWDGAEGAFGRALTKLTTERRQAALALAEGKDLS